MCEGCCLDRPEGLSCCLPSDGKVCSGKAVFHQLPVMEPLSWVSPTILSVSGFHHSLHSPVSGLTMSCLWSSWTQNPVSVAQSGFAAPLLKAPQWLHLPPGQFQTYTAAE